MKPCKCLAISLVVAAMIALTSCSDSVDDDRIPLTPVHIDLGNTGYWDPYGVHGLGSSRSFILHISPPDFPWTAATYTGFGGILLVTDLFNNPLAYDLACPVERNRDVRVVYDADNLNARCPQCKSVYNVSEFNGSPVSGRAYELKYGLRRYRVTPTPQGGYIIIQ